MWLCVFVCSSISILLYDVEVICMSLMVNGKNWSSLHYPFKNKEVVRNFFNINVEKMYLCTNQLLTYF